MPPICRWKWKGDVLGEIAEIKAELAAVSSPAKAAVLQRFFKTGPGQYGEGDVFIGVVVPEQRKIAKRHAASLPLEGIAKLLASEVHEERLTGLLILVSKYQKAAVAHRAEIAAFYQRSLPRINNWDLVDLSAPQILGAWLLDKDKAPLYSLAQSPHLWSRRVAIVATHSFIRAGEFADTLAIAELLLKDRDDLIHKAVGWMLREVGKRSESVLESFLAKRAAVMPRTALRYAIERLAPEKRRTYLGEGKR